MDFITSFPLTKKQHDSSMVVFNKLSESTHFIHVKSTYKDVNVAKIFLKEIFQIHGMPKMVTHCLHGWKRRYTSALAINLKQVGKQNEQTQSLRTC